MKRLMALAVAVFLIPLPGVPQVKPYGADWASLDARPTPAWFSDAKFGVFIHWGVYSVPAFAPTEGVDIYARYAEWYWRRATDPNQEGHGVFKAFHDRVYGPAFRYQDFAPMFKAEMFDPDAWADVFLRSGAKYVVLTSKHHDGFCLWPSAQSWNWNAVDIGPHRDLAGDLIAAVKAKGLRMGYYYSLYEWFHPFYRSDVRKYVDEHMLPQMKDLVVRYKPDLVWTDGEWDHPSGTWKAAEYLAWLFNDSPVKNDVAVNDRWGKETRNLHGGFYTTEYGRVHDKNASDATQVHPWEECRGIGFSFGYNRAERLKDYSTPDSLVHLLVDLVARGGNLLLDIGPTADGRIPVIMEERLLQMGQWLGSNGDAVYGTRPWKTAAEGMVRYTSKGKAVYAICFRKPGTALVLNAPVPSKSTTAVFLATGVPLKWAAAGRGMRIAIPAGALLDMPASPAYVITLTDHH